MNYAVFHIKNDDLLQRYSYAQQRFFQDEQGTFRFETKGALAMVLYTGETAAENQGIAKKIA